MTISGKYSRLRKICLITRMEDSRTAFNVLIVKLMGDLYESLGVVGNTISKQILKY